MRPRRPRSRRRCSIGRRRGTQAPRGPGTPQSARAHAAQPRAAPQVGGDEAAERPRAHPWFRVRFRDEDGGGWEGGGDGDGGDGGGGEEDGVPLMEEVGEELREREEAD